MKIILSVVLIALLVGCSDENVAKQKSVETKEVETVTSKVVQETEKVEETKKIVKPVQKEHKKVITTEKKVPKAETKIISSAAVDGKKLFMKCVSCHGSKAEKKALNKSQIIQGWSVAKTSKALHGYKDGTYGGSMKTVMQGQVKSYSDEEIQAVAKYILNISAS